MVFQMKNLEGYEKMKELIYYLHMLKSQNISK